MILNILAFVVAFIAMEFVAWTTHKYLMHGALWRLHKDHHQPAENHRLQKNDLFFLFFSLPGIICLYLGTLSGWSPVLFWIGVGITVYGLSYFAIHEIFIHQRIPFIKRTNNPYFSALKSAHARHHKCREKDGAECFGMLIVPWRFYSRAWKTREKSS
jgi:beta-carotene 3-hydroxylase